MEGAAVIVLTSDALLKLADGVSYSVESVGAPAVSAAAEVLQSDIGRGSAIGIAVSAAEPYMRHIAPMLARLPVSGIYKVAAGYTEADIYGTGDINIGAGIHESDGIPAPGGAMRLSPVTFAIPEIHMVPGAGTFDRDLYTADMLSIVTAVPGGGVLTDTGRGYEALISARVLEASGKPDGMQCVLYSVCRANGIGGDGAIGRETGALNALGDVKTSKAPSRSFECIFRSPIPSLSSAPGTSGASEAYEAAGSILPCEMTVPVPGAGAARNTRHTGMGLCSASMTTEIYTEPEPIQSDFDSTVITVMDVLDLTDIDVMEIKI